MTSSEPVPPALVACVDAVKALVIEHVGGDTFAVHEGRKVSLVNRETVKRLITGGSREVD